MKMNRRIVIDPQSGDTERFAAEELCRYLKRIDGGPWHVVAGDSAAPGSIRGKR